MIPLILTLPLFAQAVVIINSNQPLANSSTQLSNFTFDVSNSSHYVSSQEGEGRIEQVDCFGLGKTVAKGLEWFFISRPNGTNALDVRFFLSSRKQPDRVSVFVGQQFGLEWTDFQIDRRTVVIVHGFLSDGQEEWIYDMEKAFLQWDDVNVIIVDWSAGGNTWNYYKAAINTRVVGYQIARLLEQMTNATMKNEQDPVFGPLHLVGHSLGAHICGFTAKELRKRENKWQVERITGLDPAQPCFKDADTAVKLHKSDARFVDVIHTNGRLLSQIGFGLPEEIGHVDFYPNGGRSQPGCLTINSGLYRILPISKQLINRAVCSHGRSYLYLTESLVNAATNNCTFWARQWNLTYRDLMKVINEPCDENLCCEMGINAENYSQLGTFFVATASNEPFCINSTRITEEVQEQLIIEHAGHLKD